MENIRKIISNNIIVLRKQKGLTQVGLAKKVNFSDKAVSRWEKGEVIPDIETIYSLSKVFDVPITYFFEAHENPSFNSKKIINKNDIIFVLSIICSVWTIVSIIFAYAQIIYDIIFWQIFLWGIPVTSIICLYYGTKWRHNISKTIWKTLLNWSLITCTYLQFIDLNAWLIFIVGVPIQASIIVAALKKQKNEDIK